MVEICGLLFGDGQNITRATAVSNIAIAPETTFEIDPQALFAAIRAEREGDPKLLGYYHSHPNGAAEPSDRDRAMAMDANRLWLIIAGDKISAWQADGAGNLNPLPLTLASDGGRRQ